MEKNEKKNRRIALATSIGVHLAVLLAFLFMVAWRAPNPPLAEYGIELNFGMDTQGTGDIQPETPASAEEQKQPEETKQEEQQPQEVAEEKKEDAKQEEEQPVAKEESPVVVKETKKETKKEVEEKKEEKKEPVPVVEKKKEVKETNVAEDNKAGKQANQGDDKNKVGDKGNPEGSLDAKALYGKQGGGAGGTGLEMDGWEWDEKPKPVLPDGEQPGTLIFEIKLDADGEIVGIKTLNRGLSLEAEKICRKEIEKLTFKQTGKNVPAISTGKITFRVVAK